MSDQQPLNGAQIARLNEEMQKLASDVKFRQWCVEIAAGVIKATTAGPVQYTNVISLAEGIYKFVMPAQIT